MSPTLVWLFALLSVAIVLYVAEVFIPSHGVLTVLATACLVGVVGLCFFIDRWLGTGALVAIALLGPVGLSLGISVWQRTPVGRKMVLRTVAGEPDRPFVLIGSTGVTLTELRPMGECEFGDRRIEVKSEFNQIVPAGRPVVAIAMSDGVATVRTVDVVPA